LAVLIERYVEAFNGGDLEGALANVTTDYVYADPTSGELDKAANLDVMRQVLAAFPDRQITLSCVASGDGCEFAEGRWVGTPAGGGSPLVVTGVVVVHVEDAQMTSQRWYYDPPPGGFLDS
jgi:ketosteroid isomerase-like protein